MVWQCDHQSVSQSITQCLWRLGCQRLVIWHWQEQQYWAREFTVNCAVLVKPAVVWVFVNMFVCVCDCEESTGVCQDVCARARLSPDQAWPLRRVSLCTVWILGGVFGPVLQRPTQCASIFLFFFIYFWGTVCSCFCVHLCIVCIELTCQ